jgi:hypothetical protein
MLVIGYVIFRQLNPSIGFKYYEPFSLPPNVSIKTKRVSITRGDIQVEQNFRTEDWVYSIREYKAQESIGTADQNYDPQSVKPTCNLRTSSAKMQYHICHWIDYGRIDVHEIKFIKDGTFINTQIPSSITVPISLSQIDQFVDSFKKASTIGFPVLRSNGP